MKVAGVDVKDLPASYSSRATSALGIGDPSGGAASMDNATQMGTGLVSTLKVRHPEAYGLGTAIRGLGCW